MPRPRGNLFLEAEIARFAAENIHVVVSCLTDPEVLTQGLIAEPDLCREQGITFISHPIVDHFIPDSMPDTTRVIQELHGFLLEGKNVAIHCYAGIGRSALLAGCVLILDGMSVNDAFAVISKARDWPVPEMKKQYDWAVKFAEEHQGPES